MRRLWTRPRSALETTTPVEPRTAWSAAPGGRADAARDSARFDVVVSRTRPTTVVISLVGDHEDYAAGAFARIAQGELPHCDTLIADFTPTKKLGADVIDALIEVVGHAREHHCALQIATREHTFAHDTLDQCGILNWLDRSDRIPIR